ncbi:MAG: NAD-dependent epimerase, partial [Betaproteobacteria bacterium]
PGLTVTVAQMLDALESVAGAAARARVSVQPDERIKAIVQSWPARFATMRADALGYRGDSDILAIVRAHRATLGDGAAA